MKDFKFGEFRNDFNHAVAALKEKYDVDIKLGNITYDDVKFTTRLTVKVNTINGLDAEQVEFERRCQVFGISKDAYLARFTSGGKTFELNGFNLRARRMPIKATCINDFKNYKFTEELVKKLLPQKYLV